MGIKKQKETTQVILAWKDVISIALVKWSMIFNNSIK